MTNQEKHYIQLKRGAHIWATPTAVSTTVKAEQVHSGKQRNTAGTDSMSLQEKDNAELQCPPNISSSVLVISVLKYPKLYIPWNL